MGCNRVEKLQTTCIHGMQLSVSITNYKVSPVSLFGGQLYLSMGGVQLGVAITKYKVSHDHLPAPAHA